METSRPPLPARGTARPQNRNRTGRIFQTTLSVAILLATLFTGFSPKMLTGDLGGKFNLLLTPQAGVNPLLPTAEQTVRIGIVAGHWGNDAGSVCENGTTEQQVNLSIATLVQQKLIAQGVQVDLLQEFDPRLNGYQAAALVSIHNDSCTYVNEEATGFKVAAAQSSRDPNLASRLTACLFDRYGRATGLPFHAGSITNDMTGYHAFDEIDPRTTAAIIETGFLYRDYDILTQRPGLIADGIVAGIMCFVNNESVEPMRLPNPSP
ncbi:MAG: N-acetylmuramoyl-L-alanine amidase [Chloroflexi bacterium]|nr:N-acetylmuramoyl-L-alanine amidase [Chloroflexota bacterium]